MVKTDKMHRATVFCVFSLLESVIKLLFNGGINLGEEFSEPGRQ